MPELLIFRKDNASLADALAAAAPGALALLYAPSGCRLLRAAAGVPADLPAVYEARLFSRDSEARWVEGQGAVLLMEQGAAPAGWIREGAVPVIETIEGTYLLWGTVREATADEATLFEYRVGSIPVPCAGARAGDRLALRVREYLGVDRHGAEIYGNVAVVAERLIEVEILKQEGDHVF